MKAHTCIMRLALAISLSLSPAAYATDFTQLPLEQLLEIEVYSASRFLQKSAEAPSAVTVVTAMDIKNYGYRTLADILSGVRGLYVTNDRNYQYLGTRGFGRSGDYNTRILLQVDGYRVNDAIYDMAAIGTELSLDVALIDRVEVVRGSGSSIYGSNAFFGVVNIITKRGRDYNGWQVSGEAASFGTGKGSLTYGKKPEDGPEILLSASSYNSHGQDLFFPEFNAPATNNGIAQGLDTDRSSNVYAKLAYSGFTFSTTWSERIKGIPTASFGSAFNDPRSQTTDKHATLNLGLDKELDEKTNLSAKAYYGDYSYRGFYPYNSPPVILNQDETRGQWWGAEMKLVGHYGGHRLVAGAEYRDDFNLQQANFDIAPYRLYLDNKNKTSRNGLYIQDETAITQRVLLSAGLRYDHYSTVGDTVNPRIALIYNPAEATALKFIYGTAFRAPNVYELYYSGLGFKTNPGLNSEKVTSYEWVAEQRIDHNFRLTASVYRNEVRNLIDQVTDPADGLMVFRNIGAVNTNGIEFEAERAWENDTRLRASYAWQISRNQSTGSELTNSPRHLAKLNFSAPLLEDALRTGLELQYTSNRITLNGETTGGYLIANLTLLSRKLARGMELSATAYNLFNKQYADPGRPEHLQNVIQQNGRSLGVKIAYSF